MNNTVERVSEVKTISVFSKDKKSRYNLKMTWDETKPKCTIVMTYPSSADEMIIDQTTMLTRNNAVKQGYGSISIVNVFSLIDTLNPKTDRVNKSVIVEECSNADIVIIAYGRSMSHKEEKQAVLDMLSTYKDKLYTIEDRNGEIYSHPLSPLAREWNVIKMK